MTKAFSTMVLEVERKNEELSRLADEANAAIVAKSRFLANASHELRTPLNVIIGFSNAMEQELFGPIENEKYEEYVRDISASSRQLLESISDIIEVSTIEEGRLSLEERDIDIASSAAMYIRLVEPWADESGVKLLNEIPDDLPTLFGDARRLRQVFLNLLTNAIKFTPEGGAVKFSAEVEDDGSMLIQIVDTGVGININQMDEALRLSGESDSTVAKLGGGTGLGLPLTKSLIEAHDGTLELTSLPGKGTTAVLRFPARRIGRVY
jgi:two-component system, cell cycle sensor histidine kinase PleC